MNEFFLWSVVGLYVLIFSGLFWIMFCNDKTYKKLMQINKELYDTYSIEGQMKKGKTDILDVDRSIYFILMNHIVSYDSHMYALLFLRDWRKLYPEELRKALPESFK